MAVLVATALIVEASSGSERCLHCLPKSSVSPNPHLLLQGGHGDAASLCTFARITALRPRGGSGYEPSPADEDAADQALDDLYDNIKKVHFCV